MLNFASIYQAYLSKEYSFPKVKPIVILQWFALSNVSLFLFSLFFLVEKRFHHVGQGGLKLLTLGYGPPKPPTTLASQSAGIIGVSHHAQHVLYISKFGNMLNSSFHILMSRTYSATLFY